ncbi:MAG: hypothetical protein A4E57_02823 [Syntrophorhabdaceae bacterium PtaU1.Bin034]|nr:MAG: hypothetical protein A4E57_02823 [Syntrophorhabdaceae bacterium PtaU1.Bin034]
MGKGVCPDNRLVRLHGRTGNRSDEPARRVYLLAYNLGVRGKDIPSCPKDHDDLFHCRITRTFSYAVDRAFHLAGAGLHRSNRVGDGQAEIVMTVDTDNGPGNIRYMIHDVADQRTELIRDRIADRVRHVYGSRSCIDRHLKDTAKVVPIASRCIHRRELNVVRVASCPLHRLLGDLQNFIPVFPKLVLQMDIRRGDEGMDAWFHCVLNGFPRPVDIFEIGPGKTRDLALSHDLGDLPDRFKVAFGGNGKAGFDDVNAKRLKLLCNPKLLLGVHRVAGRLFTIP